ncbi:hypothetical protein JCM14469_19990 [Desulfatiferula olefinivorans]
MTDVFHPPCEDEIELIDILRILYKRKWLIVSGVLLFGLSALLISIAMPRIYRVSMTVQPGIMPSSEDGRRVMIDSIETIVARISAGVYDDVIIEQVLKDEGPNRPQRLDFSVDNPKQSDVLVISYDTDRPEVGVTVLDALFDCLSRRENDLVGPAVEHLNRKITLDTLELNKKKEIEQSYIAGVAAIDRRIRELQTDIEANGRNNGHLNAEREKLLKRGTDADTSLAVLLYSNSIQQTIQFVNAVKRDLNDHQMLRETMMQDAITARNDQKMLAEQIAMNIRLRDHIVSMAMIRKPAAGPDPVSPRTLLVVVLAVTAGFFVMTMVSFFWEYIQNHPVSIDDRRDESLI